MTRLLLTACDFSAVPSAIVTGTSRWIAALLALLIVFAPAHAGTRVFRLGHLAVVEESAATSKRYMLPELARLNYAIGRNLELIERIGGPDIAALAQDLVAKRPDVIVAIGATAAQAARAATRTIPIVMFADDPVAIGMSSNLARPDGNVTGIVNLVVELHGKRLELLIEAVPAARRIAVLLKKTSATRSKLEVLSKSQSTGTVPREVQVLLADDATDYPRAFAEMRRAGADALLIGPDPKFFADRVVLAEMALKAGLPTVCEWPSMVSAGCMIGYGADHAALRIRIAQMVAALLGGARPGDLPFEQPTRLGLAVNFKTAKALGLSLPPSILVRADEVIE